MLETTAAQVGIPPDQDQLPIERMLGGAQPSEKVNALIRKVRQNKFGKAQAPPPLIAPKVKEVAPPAEAAEPVEAAAAE